MSSRETTETPTFSYQTIILSKTPPLLLILAPTLRWESPAAGDLGRGWGMFESTPSQQSRWPLRPGHPDAAKGSARLATSKGPRVGPPSVLGAAPHMQGVVLSGGHPVISQGVLPAAPGRVCSDIQLEWIGTTMLVMYL